MDPGPRLTDIVLLFNYGKVHILWDFTLFTQKKTTFEVGTPRCMVNVCNGLKCRLYGALKHTVVFLSHVVFQGKEYVSNRHQIVSKKPTTLNILIYLLYNTELIHIICDYYSDCSCKFTC